MPVRAPRSLADYLKAFDFFRRRTALDDEAIEGIESKAREKAFNIASHAQLGIVSRVMKDAKKAMRRGKAKAMKAMIQPIRPRIPWAPANIATFPIVEAASSAPRVPPGVQRV